MCPACAPRPLPTFYTLNFTQQPLSSSQFDWVWHLWASAHGKDGLLPHIFQGADNQGAGEQGRPVRQNMYRGYRPRFRRYAADQLCLCKTLSCSDRDRTWLWSDAALLKPSLTFRGPPRQRQPREDGNEEDKENQGDETQSQQPPQRRYRRNFNYRRRRPENPKPQDGKETKAAEPAAENTSAPEAEQGGAE